MTTSKRVAERKIARFERNIAKRGSVSESWTKKLQEYGVWPIFLFGFFICVVIASYLFQMRRKASQGEAA